MFSAIYRFFDKLEDRIRHRLSHHVFLYGFLGGALTVLFWRSVWHGADELGWGWLMPGIFSVIGLMLMGVFTSVFIGEHIIISGLRNEKKKIDETEEEVVKETERTDVILQELREIKEALKSRK